MDEHDLKLVLVDRDFAQIFQHAPVGLCVLDREYRYLMINARMAQLNGHPVADHLGRSVDEMVPGLAEKIKAELRPVLDNGEPERGRLFAGPLPEDPSKVGHWLANYFPLRSEDGSVRGVIATLVEITELKRVERELRLSEGRLELALRAGNLGIWDGDLQTGQYYFSDQYKRMLGYEPEEMANDSAAFFRLLHPEDTAAVTAAYAAHLRGETPLFRTEFRMQHKDGSWRWIRSEGQAERDSQGHPLRVAGVHVEITEIKQAEAALRESERRLNLAQIAGGVGVFDWDLVQGRGLWTPGLAAILGLPAEPTTVDLSDWQRRVHPEDLVQADAPVEQAIQERRREAEGDYRIVRPDGEIRWLTSRAEISYAPSGQPLRAVGVSVDITDRKRSEERLRQAELRFRRFLEAVPVGVVQWTSDYVVIDANQVFLQMLNITREDVQAGRIQLLQRTPEALRGMSEQALAELFRRGVYGPFEKAYLRTDGSLVPVLVSSVAYEHEGRREVTSFVLDLTAQKATERAWRESEERLRFHVENMTLAVVEWDATFHVTRWSSQAERLFGWRAAETVGKYIADLHLIYGEDVPQVDEVMRRLADGVSRHVVGMNRNVSQDGRVLHCRWYNSVLTDEQGRMESVMSLVEDCTASVQAEELLREAKRAAEEANTAKRQFLASMSHEMRTPLTAIIGFSELLADRDVSAEKQLEYVEATQRNARLLLTLVDEVLDFSKIEAGKMELAPQDCLLHEVLQDVLSATGLSAEKKQLRLELNCRYPLPETIRTDPRRLWQILVNLVTNAIKFTDRGGVWITVKMAPAGPEGARLRFTVGDTGPGVSPEFESRLFEPFAQAATLTPGGGGVGLGLPIAARLAELLGSRLELERRSAAGASFSFVLDPGPLDERRMLWGVPGTSAAELPLADRLEGRVLLAEDAVDTQQLFRVYLQNAGLHVEVVSDGLAAVRRVLASATSAAPYDLVLLDLQLPHLDGYEAARLLRASAWSGPLVALGAHAATDDGERCRDAGFDQFLSKPITREILLAAVQRCLPQRHLRGGAAAATTAPSAPASGHLNAGRLRAPSAAVPAPAPGPGPRQQQEARRYRVLLADDDELVRAALRLLVDQLTDFEVVAEAADGREALDSLRRHQPEIALMDIAMPHLDGLNATARVAAVSPHTKVIILSAFAGQETVLQALQAGAAGYLLKNAGPRELERALSAVAGGGTYYGEVVQQHVPAQPTN